MSSDRFVYERRCGACGAKREQEYVLASLYDEANHEIARLRAALAPFAAFAAAFDAQPLSNLVDEFYAIHTGTKWEASLRLSDCRKARAALGAQP